MAEEYDLGLYEGSDDEGSSADDADEADAKDDGGSPGPATRPPAASEMTEQVLVARVQRVTELF